MGADQLPVHSCLQQPQSTEQQMLRHAYHQDTGTRNAHAPSHHGLETSCTRNCPLGRSHAEAPLHQECRIMTYLLWLQSPGLSAGFTLCSVSPTLIRHDRLMVCLPPPTWLSPTGFSSSDVSVSAERLLQSPTAVCTAKAKPSSEVDIR